jgi:hypothetical protein
VDLSGEVLTAMMKFFGQMMKLPMAALVSSMEMLAKTMREIQKSFESNIDVVSTGLGQTLNDMADGTGVARAASTDGSGNLSGDGADTTQQIIDKEANDMGDQDLGGEDLKVVRYRIIFTKRDFEAVLDGAEEEIVDYPTDGGSFGGLKVAEFMGKLTAGAVDLPVEWRGKKDYPPKKEGKWRIPRDDRRYIKFVYEVIRTIEREEPAYEKDEVKVLRQIRDAIHERG